MEKQELRRKITATILTMTGLCVVLVAAIWLLATSSVFSPVIQWLMIGCCVLLAFAILGFCRNKIIEIRTLRTCVRERDVPSGSLQSEEEDEDDDLEEDEISYGTESFYKNDDSKPAVTLLNPVFTAVPDTLASPAEEVRDNFEAARQAAQARKDAQDPMAQGAAQAVAAAAAAVPVFAQQPGVPQNNAKQQPTPQHPTATFADASEQQPAVAQPPATPNGVPVQRQPQPPQQRAAAQAARAQAQRPAQQGVPVQRQPQPLRAPQNAPVQTAQGNVQAKAAGQSAPSQAGVRVTPITQETSIVEENIPVKLNVAPISWPTSTPSRPRPANAESMPSYATQQQAMQAQLEAQRQAALEMQQQQHQIEAARLAQQQEALRLKAEQDRAAKEEAERAAQEEAARRAADAADAAARRASEAAERAAARLREAAGLPPLVTEPAPASTETAQPQTAQDEAWEKVSSPAIPQQPASWLAPETAQK